MKETLWSQPLVSDPQHSPRSDRSVVMHEDEESVAGSERDKETERDEGESVQ